VKRTDGIRYPGLIIRSQQKTIPVFPFHRLLSSHFILKTKIGSGCLPCIFFNDVLKIIDLKINDIIVGCSIIIVNFARSIFSILL